MQIHPNELATQDTPSSAASYTAFLTNLLALERARMNLPDALELEVEDVAWVSVSQAEFDQLFTIDASWDTWYLAMMVPKRMTGSKDFRRCPYASCASGLVWNLTSNTIKMRKFLTQRRGY